MNQIQYRYTPEGHILELRLSKELLLTYHQKYVIKTNQGYLCKDRKLISDDMYHKGNKYMFRIIIDSANTVYIKQKDIEYNRFILLIDKSSIEKSIDCILFKKILPLTTTKEYIDSIKKTLVAMSENINLTKNNGR